MKYLVSFKNYLVDSVHEMKKVTWPTKTQTQNYTIFVVIMSVGVALFFGIIDYVLNLGLEQII
ncbi:preprotein translocase subunit SecE [Patescibacteria group bacterium]|nr:preprotein translocase subunit SecE [Patescibacteria group bacterium]MBU1721203.1 preprotein translocase subunit SecE [Patescibacteria group bacterium]MBU1901089.1 preprotein translocase subunit SecE [Patescibacteria group bacterium]